MTIALASDHAGFPLKIEIKEYIQSSGFDVLDYGPETEERVDYPDYGSKVASAVSRGTYEKGILICGSGLGMSMVANRFSHVRAALCHNVEMARLARQHNDSNILVLGGRFLEPEEAFEILDTWLATDFEGGRHTLRLQKLDSLTGI